MADEITLKFTVDGAKALDATKKQQAEIKRLEELWDKAADAERRCAVEASKLSASKLFTADIGKLAAGWREMTGTIASVAGAVGSVVQTGARFMVEAEKQSAAINRLGAAYEAVSAATNGAMSAQQALTLQGQIQAAGVRVSADQLGMLARAAREYALATGNDASEATEKLTNAIVNNSADALSELGLSQARATTSTQTLANMTRELHRRFDGIAPTARTLGEDLEKLPGVINLIGNTAAQAAATGLRSFIDALHGAGTATAIWRDITNFADDRRTLDRQGQSQDAMNRRQALRERIQRQAQGVGARFNSDLLQGMSERELQSVSSRLEVGTGVRGQSARGGDLNAVFGSIVAQNDLNLNMNGQFEGIVNAVRNEERMRQRREAAGEARPVDENVRRKESIAKELANATDGVSHSFERMAKTLETSGLAAEMDHAATRAKQFASALGSINDDLPFTVQSMAQLVNVANLNSMATSVVGADRAFRNRFQTAGNALGLAGSTDDEQASLFGSIADSVEAGASDRAERSRRNRIANRDRETRIQSVSRGRSVGAGVLRGLGVSADAMETEAKLTQGYADTIVGAYGKIGDAITRHIELVASGQETIGQAALNGMHEVTKALAMEAFPKALMETAAGLAALTNPVTAPTAPLHFAAAGVYGAVAAGAGLVAGVTGALGAGQTAGGAAGARATGAGRAAAGTSPRPAQEQAAPVTIYLNSTVPPGPRELQGLVQATAQAGRYNLDRRRDMVPRAVRA